MAKVATAAATASTAGKLSEAPATVTLAHSVQSETASLPSEEDEESEQQVDMMGPLALLKMIYH